MPSPGPPPSAPRRRRCPCTRPSRREPGVVAELAFLGDRVERPEQLAGAHVEAAYVELHLRLRAHPRADSARGADDHDVADDDRGRRRACLDVAPSARAGRARRSTTPASPNSRLGKPVVASSDHRKKPRRHDEYALVFRAAAPVGDAAARHLARPFVEAAPLVRPPDPKSLARLCVDRDDVPRCTRGRVEHAADHQRRVLALSSGVGPKFAADQRHATLRSFTLRALI